LTPTDPVLISSIIKGSFADKYVPKRLRDLIAAESGANDALGFCFLYMPFYFARISFIPSAIGFFLLNVVLYQLVLGILMGFAIGIAFSKLLQISAFKGWIERESLLGVLLALTVRLEITLVGVYRNNG
jgi:NhaP-type Na+/H+ or K+/H+ antiporter